DSSPSSRRRRPTLLSFGVVPPRAIFLRFGSHYARPCVRFKTQHSQRTECCPSWDTGFGLAHASLFVGACYGVAMTITPYLKGKAFDPDLIRTMGAAYERDCNALDCETTTALS